MLINNIENVFCRLDVIEVYINKKSYKLNYLKNCILERPYKRKLKEEGDEYL